MVYVYFTGQALHSVMYPARAIDKQVMLFLCVHVEAYSLHVTDRGHAAGGHFTGTKINSTADDTIQLK